MSVFDETQLGERFTEAAPLPQGSFLYRSFVVRDTQAGGAHRLVKVLSKGALGGGKGVAAAARALDTPPVPGVARLLDVTETAGCAVLVLEYFGGGDLHARAGKWRVPEDEAKTIFLQLARAVAALHARGRVHGEVRADNVFFGSPVHAFLGDAGVSSLFGPAAVRGAVSGERVGLAFFFSLTSMRTQVLAVPQHAAPELIEQNRRHELPAPLQQSSDVWSLGVVLFALLAGTHPFAGRSFDDILGAHVTLEAPRWKCYSHQAKLLVQRLLVRDAAARPTLPQLLADPWLADAQPPPEGAELLRVPPPPRTREVVELLPEPERLPSRAQSVVKPEPERLPSRAQSSVKSSTAARGKREREEPEVKEEAPVAARAAPASPAAVASPERSNKAAKQAETEESLSALKVVDLKGRCRELGLTQSGKKADLIARILERLAKQ